MRAVEHTMRLQIRGAAEPNAADTEDAAAAAAAGAVAGAAGAVRAVRETRHARSQTDHSCGGKLRKYS